MSLRFVLEIKICLLLQDLLRKNQRALSRAIFDLDRERTKMEAQEKKIIADIKKMAKEGQMV